MNGHDLSAHEHILDMFQFMTQSTSLNPPVLETYTSVYSLIERRQSTDMIDLAKHILFLAQMQTQADLAGQVQAVREKWVLQGNPMPEQFIYEITELFASIGYRFRVVQWTAREQAFNQLVSASNTSGLEAPLNPWDIVLSGFRIEQNYTSFTPWPMNSHGGQYHDFNMPQQQPLCHSLYRTDLKIEFNCIGCPSCDFCTKDKKDILKHESHHCDPVPCTCARQNHRFMAMQLDTMTCHCGRLATDGNARMLRSWEDEETGQSIRRFGNSEVMPVFADTTAIQMWRDVTHSNMETLRSWTSSRIGLILD
jgi:hypothetical protein